MQVIDKTTNKIATRNGLFRWLVFNIVVGNDDCHLKNLSFHVSSDGIELARHYDLLCTGAYNTKTFADENGMWNQVPMAFALPGAKTFGDVTLGSVLAAAEQLGLPEPVARRIVREVSTRVEKEFARIVADDEEKAKKTPPERWKTMGQPLGCWHRLRRGQLAPTRQRPICSGSCRWPARQSARRCARQGARAA